MPLQIKKFNAKIEEKLKNHIKINNNGYLRKGAITKIVEESLEFYLENLDQVESWKKQKKIKKTLKAIANF